VEIRLSATIVSTDNTGSGLRLKPDLRGEKVCGGICCPIFHVSFIY